MIVLDASVLIAHLNPHEYHHDTASDLLLAGATETLMVHAVTMAEVLVGGAKLGRAEVLLGELTDIGVQVATADSGEPLRLAVLRVDTGLKLPDCCVLSVAVSHRATLATFDTALRSAARRSSLFVLP